MSMIKCKLYLYIYLHLYYFIIFITIILRKDEKNPKLVEIYKGKMNDYFERAEYIRKTVLKPCAE